MQKPVAQNIEVHDIMSITDKYHLDLELNDIWHWFVDNYEPNNGNYITLYTEIYPKDKD